MDFNASPTIMATATMSPTATDTFASHVFRSSMSSLALSTGSLRHSQSSISKTYRQASTLFLTRRLPEALSTIVPLISSSSPTPTNGTAAHGNPFTEPAPIARASRTTRVKVWSLYLTILNAIVELDAEEGKASFGAKEWRSICSKVREGDVWEEVVRDGYHGVEGDVDSDVVINLATLLLSHAKDQSLNQKRLESFLAASNSPNLDLTGRFQTPSTPHQRHRSPVKSVASGADTPRDLNARVKILELYTLHVLLRNNEWDYAREFISVSSVLDEERREAFLQALQSLQEEQQEAENREHAERRRQEDQLREELEEARRLRAENEERERRRLEEERLRSEGSEVDYGIDVTTGGGGGTVSSRTKPGVSSRRPGNKTLAKDKSVAPPSIGARAVGMFSNLRVLIEQMSMSMRSNPVVLMRLLAFLVGLIAIFGRKNIRERVLRMLGSSWDKIKATAGMGVKVSYI